MSVKRCPRNAHEIAFPLNICAAEAAAYIYSKTSCKYYPDIR